MHMFSFFSSGAFSVSNDCSNHKTSWRYLWFLISYHMKPEGCTSPLPPAYACFVVYKDHHTLVLRLCSGCFPVLPVGQALSCVILFIFAQADWRLLSYCLPNDHPLVRSHSTPSVFLFMFNNLIGGAFFWTSFVIGLFEINWHSGIQQNYELLLRMFTKTQF